MLREFTHADWPAVLAYQSDRRYLRYYPWWDRSAADVRALVGRFIIRMVGRDLILFDAEFIEDEEV